MGVLDSAAYPPFSPEPYYPPYDPMRVPYSTGDLPQPTVKIYPPHDHEWEFTGILGDEEYVLFTCRCTEIRVVWIIYPDPSEPAP